MTEFPSQTGLKFVFKIGVYSETKDGKKHGDNVCVVAHEKSVPRGIYIFTIDCMLCVSEGEVETVLCNSR